MFSFTQQGLDGAVYQMLAHGISTGALFMLVGMMYERRHSLEIEDYGGVATPAPWLSTVFLITTLASIGLPTLSNSSASFWSCRVLRSRTFPGRCSPAWGLSCQPVTCSGCISVCFSDGPRACLKTRSHGHGAGGHDPDTHAQADPHVTHEHSGFHLPDLSGREWAALAPMLILMLWMGVAAQSFLPSIGASNATLLNQTKGSVEQNVKLQPGNEVARAH